MERALYIIIAALVIVVDLSLTYLACKNKRPDTRLLPIPLFLAGVCEFFYLGSALTNDYFVMKCCLAVFFACIPVMLAVLLNYMSLYLNIKQTRVKMIFRTVVFILVAIDVINELANPFFEQAMQFEYHAEYVAQWTFVPLLPYKLHLGLCYVIIAAVVVQLVQKVFQTAHVYRHKYITIIFGLVAAVGINAFCLVFQDKGMLDYSQVSYTLLSVILYWDAYQSMQRGLLNSVRKMIFDELDRPIALFGENNILALRNDPMSFLIRDSGLHTTYCIKDFIAKTGFDGALANSTNDTHFQWRYRSANGHIANYRVDFRALKDRKGCVFGRLFVFTDRSLETDLLTGFLSKNTFKRQFSEPDAMAELQYPVAVAICDLNGLTQLNLKQGTDQGDAAIIALARIMERCCPPDSLFARLEDANLLVLCQNTDTAAMRSHIAQVKSALRTLDIAGHRLDMQSAIAVATEQDPNVLKAVDNASTSMRSRKLMDGTSSHSSLLGSLAQVLIEHDPATEAHVRRTRDLAERLGERLGFPDIMMSNLALLCLLHDIGKIAIPAEIIKKPGPLNDIEWAIIKTHVTKGYNIANASPELKPIANAILHHHESWDGTGYPDGLSHESIPLLSRIITVVDSYDAMVNDRPYHKGVDEATARAELKRCSGKQFDPHLVTEFIQVLEQTHPLGTVKEEEGSKTAVPTDILEFPEVNPETAVVKPLVFTQYYLDADNYIVRIDEEFTRITGYTEKDLTAYHLSQWDLVPPEDRSAYMENVKELLTTMGRADIEHRIMRKDGSYLYVNCFGRPMVDPVTGDRYFEVIALDLARSNTVLNAQRAERESVRRLINRWESTARRDSLTGALNHASFIRDCEEALLESDKRVCFLMLDVDQFKQFNDTFGHVEGDRILTLVANILTSLVGDDGLVGRMGGDEFAAVLKFNPDCDMEEVQNMVDDVFRGITAMLADERGNVSVSFGAALANKQSTFSDLYMQADKALYSSKDAGRCRVTFSE